VSIYILLLICECCFHLALPENLQERNQSHPNRNQSLPKQSVSSKVIIIDCALGVAAEMQEFSFSQKFTTPAKIFSNATTVGKIAHTRLSRV